MRLVSKTGGSTLLKDFHEGLFLHCDELFVAREKWWKKWEHEAYGDWGTITVIRCADGKNAHLEAKASIYPVEIAS
jgi:hypothetical protein